MKRTSAIWMTAAVLVALAGDLNGARRRAVVPGNSDVLAVEFVDIHSSEGSMTTTQSEAWLDMGRIAKQDQRQRGVTVRRRFGVRVTRSGGIVYGTARITARLESWDGKARVRLDGRPITATPMLVDASAPIGGTIAHRLEIDVADTARAGPIAASIVWEATTN
jgi:hypothetical protein